MRLARRRDDEGRALLERARSGDQDALALLRCGLTGTVLARLRDALGTADVVAGLRGPVPAAAAQVLREAGVGPAALAELRGDDASAACRGGGLVALGRAAGAPAAERELAEDHARVCRACR